MKKRTISILFALSITAISITGCGNKTEPTVATVETEATETEATETESTETIVETEIIEETETIESTENSQVESTETEAIETNGYTYTDLDKTMYAQSAVNLRDLPDKNGNKVGGLSTNQEVTVTGQCNETGWYKINYNGEIAYVSNNYLGDSKAEIRSTNTQPSTSTPDSTNNDSPNYLTEDQLYQIYSEESDKSSDTSSAEDWASSMDAETRAVFEAAGADLSGNYGGGDHVLPDGFDADAFMNQ